MQSMISNLFRGAGAKGDRKVSKRKPRRFRPTADGLEARLAMSLGGGFPINVAPAQTTGVASGSSSNGMSAVAWTEDYPNFVSAVLVQRFTHGGQLTGELGSPVLVDFVDLKGTKREYEPSIAFDAQGKFVVSWLTEDLNPKNVTSTIMARRFDASGNPLGPSFVVNAGTHARDAHVAADAAGNFVVAYTTNNLAISDIQAKLYNSAGGLVRVISVAATTKNASRSSVAMTADGQFDIAYQYAFSSTNSDVYMSRFSATGGLIGTSSVATSSASEGVPSVAVDDAGNAVVAYQKFAFVAGNYSESIGVRRVTSAGVVSAEMILPSKGIYAISPSVAVKRTGGAFVVGYVTTPAFGELYSPTAYVTEVNANNVATGTFSVGTYQGGPALSIDGANQYLVGTLDVLPAKNPHDRFGTLA
jgi:hypothetical protein